MLSAEAIKAAEGCGVYVAAVRRGLAHNASKRITVPAWVFDTSINFCGKAHVQGGNAFAAYYLAHELSHVVSLDSGHGRTFMLAFMRLCPAALQKYESVYKPRNAKAAGIEMIA